MSKATLFGLTLERLMITAFFAVALFSQADATLLKFKAELDGAQANAGTGTGSAATGFATVQFDTLSGTISVDLSVQGIALADLLNVGPNSTPVHIHNAPAGANGGIVWDLGFYAPFIEDGAGIRSTATNVVYDVTQGSLTSPLTVDAFEQSLSAGNTYLNIHTVAFPPGEIRGQITSVPATASIVLMAGGLLGLRFVRRRPSGSARP